MVIIIKLFTLNMNKTQIMNETFNLSDLDLDQDSDFDLEIEEDLEKQETLIPLPELKR